MELYGLLSWEFCQGCYSNSNKLLLKKEYLYIEKKSEQKHNFSYTMDTFYWTWKEFLSLTGRYVFLKTLSSQSQGCNTGSFRNIKISSAYPNSKQSVSVLYHHSSKQFSIDKYANQGKIIFVFLKRYNFK